MSVMFDPDMAIYPPPPKPTPLSTDEKTYYRERIEHLLKERNAMVVAHYYTDPEIQQLAEETGGCISDSLEVVRFDAKHPAPTLLVIGVRSMGETVETLSPEETILVPTFQAEYLLGPGCPAEEFNTFCNAHPDRTVVVYANTSVAVKACADQAVTSSIIVESIDHFDSPGEKTIWASDKHLGRYVRKQTGGDILYWQGACIVHDEFKTQALTRLQEEYPNTAILVRSESPQAIVGMADAVGSTSQLITAAKISSHQRLTMATGRGTFYKVQQAMPDKELLEVLTVGEDATCRSCAHCPWVAMNGLQAIVRALEQEGSNHEAHVDGRLRERTLVPLNRIPDFVTILRGQRITRRNVTPWGKNGSFQCAGYPGTYTNRGRRL